MSHQAHNVLDFVVGDFSFIPKVRPPECAFRVFDLLDEERDEIE